MGCSQSKSADVLNVDATTSVAKTVEPKMKELKTEELEIEELQKQHEEPVDETVKTLEPTSLVIDTLVTEQQVPDSSAVDVPDSVRANFSSFNISFIDPTVSAPTSATTEPNVASLRVAVITEEAVNKDTDETLRVEVAVKEVEPNVAKSLANTNTEEIADEQAELEKIEEQVEESAATTEEFVATIERGMEPIDAEVVVESLAAVLQEEIVVEEQIDIKTEEVEVLSVSIVASGNIEQESGTKKTVEGVEERPITETNESVAAVAETISAVAETVAASEETCAAVSTTEEGGEPTNEDNAAQPVDEEKFAESVVVNVAEPLKEKKVAEPVKERGLGQFVVEKAAELVVENVADLEKEKKASEPVKDENKAAELVMEKVTAKEVVQKVAEPDVDEKSVDAAKEKTDGESVKPAEVTAVGDIAVLGEKSDVVDKAIVDLKESATIIDEPVAVAISNQTEAVAETRPTEENKLDGSLASEDGSEAEDLVFITDNKEAAELKTKVATRAEESVASN